MKCEEIIRRLEEDYPPSCAEDWDNPGLLVGRKSREVRHIFVALDVTDETLAQAVACGADLFVSHHPLIFGSIRQINEDSFLGRRILTLAEQGISCYAMHTNFDIRGMADLNERQLRLSDTEVLLVTGEHDGKPEGIGRVGTLPEPMHLSQLTAYVKQQLGVPSVRCYGTSERQFSRVAISGGSGKSVVSSALQAGAQALVTGDIDYHTAIDALADGLHILDAGHYGTEYCFIGFLAEKLRRLFPECEVTEAKICHPYTE